MYKPLCRFVVSLNARYSADLQDDLQDIVQETFLTLWKKRKQLANHENIHGWLYITTKNKYRDRFGRWSTAKQHHSFSFDEEGRFVVAEDDLRVEAQDELQRQKEKIIAIVGEEAYALLLQYYDESIDNGDIAKMFGIPRASLRVRIHRIILSLRKHDFALFLLLVVTLNHLDQ